MIIPSEKLRIQLAEAISKVLSSMDAPMSMEEVYGLFGTPPNPKMGHLAFPCFSFAKILRKGPPVIANEIASSLELPEGLAEILPAGPYLNFRFLPQALGNTVAEAALSGEMFQRSLTKDSPRTMIEFSQPNTHKQLHVGHMRNLCLGDALVKMFRYIGYDVVSSTFPGDMGTHVAKCLWYLKYHNDEPAPETDKGAWLGAMYVAANSKLEAELGTDKEATNRSQLTEILKQLEHEEGEFYDIWKETREWSIQLMEEAYSWANVEFDKWYWESEVDKDSIELVKKYQEKGLFVESQGAIGMDLSNEEEDLGFALLLKSDGTGLYATKDVELARRKFEDYDIQKNVYVVDFRQERHFKQVFKVLEKMGFDRAKDCYHLKYEMVGGMSSRKGNFVPLMVLVKEMEHTIRENYLEKYRGDWPDEEIDLTATQIAMGAIKYGMLRYDPGSKIEFKMEEWINVSGESGPAVQYACARINSMAEKLGYSADKKVDWSMLTADNEIAILAKMSEFNDMVVTATEKYKTNNLCTWLFELRGLVNSFYQQTRIKDTEDEILKHSRLAMTVSAGKVLEKGLSLLGIPVPARM